MSQIASLLLIFLSSLAFFSIDARADQDRAPHGLAYESPIALTPSAVEFFHPKTKEPETKNPCSSSNCSPLPVAAQVEATQTHDQSQASTVRNGGCKVGPLGAAGIVVGSAFVMLLAMSV